MSRRTVRTCFAKQTPVLEVIVLSLWVVLREGGRIRMRGVAGRERSACFCMYSRRETSLEGKMWSLGGGEMVMGRLGGVDLVVFIYLFVLGGGEGLE